MTQWPSERYASILRSFQPKIQKLWSAYHVEKKWLQSKHNTQKYWSRSNAPTIKKLLWNPTQNGWNSKTNTRNLWHKIAWIFILSTNISQANDFCIKKWNYRCKRRRLVVKCQRGKFAPSSTKQIVELWPVGMMIMSQFIFFFGSTTQMWPAMCEANMLYRASSFSEVVVDSPASKSARLEAHCLWVHKLW